MASKGDLGALRAQLSERGVSTVHLVLQDLDGGLRERRIRLADLERTIGKGTSFCDVLYQWDVGDSVFTPGPFLGEAIAADVDSLRGYPFEPHAAWVVADFAGPSAAGGPPPRPPAPNPPAAGGAGGGAAGRGGGPPRGGGGRPNSYKK